MDQEAALKNLAMQNEDVKKHNKLEPSYHYVAHKAGMQQVDKEKVTAIIAEASKNSRYYNREMQKKEKQNLSIDKIKLKIEKVQKDKQEVQGIKSIIEKKLNQMEKERILSRTWVHVDMDMFFVACEIRDNPELKDKPVAVGGMDMISTANYVARQYGIRSAMPGFMAKKLCPELILIHGNGSKYRETSRRFKNIVEEYDPEYESGGLDEAVLDLTSYLNEHGLSTPEEIEKVCYNMRMKINDATGITCSCGIGPNKMLAKLSTEINKPNGQYYMKPDKEIIQDFLAKLPVRKVPGIGNVYEQVLHGLEIMTCKDILERLVEVYIGFSENAFDFFLRSALGVGRCYHELAEDRKQIGISRTFPVISKVPDMEKKVREIAGLLAQDLQHYKKKGKHFTLSIKTHNFDMKNRSTPVDRFIDDEVEIGNIGIRLLKELLPLDPLRLIGLKATQLSTEENLHSLDNLFKKTASKTKSNNTTTTVIIPNISVQQPQIEIKGQDTKETKSKDSIMIKEKEYADTTPFPGMLAPKEIDEASKTSVVSAPPNQKPEGGVDNTKHLTKQRSKGDEIICPICFMKFESSVNKTRINNHIDKCLAASEGGSNFANVMQPVFAPKSDTSNKGSDNSKTFFDVEEKKEKEKDKDKDKEKEKEKKDNGKKRKAEEDTSKTRGNLKKTKKNPDVSNMKKLENFFAKK